MKGCLKGVREGTIVWRNYEPMHPSHPQCCVSEQQNRASDEIMVSQVAIRGLADLVVQCTAFSPDHRPSFADILQVGRRPLPAQVAHLQLFAFISNSAGPRPPHGAYSPCYGTAWELDAHKCCAMRRRWTTSGAHLRMRRRRGRCWRKRRRSAWRGRWWGRRPRAAASPTSCAATRESSGVIVPMPTSNLTFSQEDLVRGTRDGCTAAV